MDEEKALARCYYLGGVVDAMVLLRDGIQAELGGSMPPYGPGLRMALRMAKAFEVAAQKKLDAAEHDLEGK